MTRAQLIAVAVAVTALGAGTVRFFTAQSGSPQFDTFVGGAGMLEILDRSKCTVAACNAPLCQQAQAALDDAGQPCTVGFVDCSVRLGTTARAIAADAGAALSSSSYVRARLVGMRCSAIDGGFAYAVPVDDAGWPVYMVNVTTPLCVRAPLDGGNTCLRDDGSGPRFFGTGNVFPAAQASGTNCDQVECTVVYGDDPAVSL
jgi:hypothetical protein